MSDHNFRDRHSPKWQPSTDGPRGPQGPRTPEVPTARPGAPAARTVVGLPGAGPPVARPGLSGRTPGQPEDPITLSGVAPPSEAHRDDGLTPDKQYMEAPSEIMVAAPTPTPTPRAPQPDHAAATPPPPPPQSPYSASAPESWRSAARNVAERSKKSGRPNPKSDSQHLRLKLDGDSYDDYYRGVPKSRLPVVVLAFLLLLAAAGGGAYWAQDHGGLAGLAARLHLTVQERLATEPTADEAPGSHSEGVTANQQQPATAAAPSVAATSAQPGAAPATPQLPAAAQPRAESPGSATGKQPAAIGAPGAAQAQAAAANPASDTNVRALAEPDMPGAEPVAPTAAKVAPAKAPAPARPATRRASPAPTVIRHDPVIKIRELGGSSTPGAPPEPSGTPYVPAVPIDPPAPDEPR